MNQKDTILQMLRQGPVCGTTLLGAHMPRYSAAVFDLREEGHNIETRRCIQHTHHKTRQVEFVLHGAPGQMGLASDKSACAFDCRCACASCVVFGMACVDERRDRDIAEGRP